MSLDTPLMRQYMEIKKKHQGEILFFRMGDFYEMFGEDAIKASKVLEIALTTRNKNSDEPVPLCGVPYHAADAYIAKLIKRGLKVAVCEQVEDPKTAKGIVKREVIRVITPGTLLEDNLLTPSENNFLLSVANYKKKTGLAFIDISTGEFYLAEFSEGDQEKLIGEIERIAPSEILLPKGAAENGPLAEIYRRYRERIDLSDDWRFDPGDGESKLLEHFGVSSLDGFGVAGMSAALAAASAAFIFLSETQGKALANIRKIRAHNPASYMILDEVALKNLEVIESPSGREGTLLHCLGRTVTSMGGRRLSSWLVRPLMDLHSITLRHEAVAELAYNFSMRDVLRDSLKEISDLERLMGRICSGVAGPRDLANLRNSLQALPKARAAIAESGALRLSELKSIFSDNRELLELLERALSDDVPPTLKDGGVIRVGYNSELDKLRRYFSEGRGIIASIEADERAKTGIETLKVRYNKVFGYYIEITRARLAKVPDYFIRKQTLVNAERYITPELKEYEEKVLGAGERILELEGRLFAELREQVSLYAASVQATAEVIAEFDALASLAEAAVANGYVRPEMDDGETIEIRDGRHPVVEDMVGREKFVPNDCRLDSETKLAIITGPNMAGKSTYMRQVALIVLMAQAGSFVPAASAKLGISDRIFTRVGAADNIARGQSTFMVEMNETANILNNATGKSLVILDEIGRGTSTFDGLSIAWAVAEFIHDNISARTLFATHYHELTTLASTLARAKNFNVSVKEWKDEIIFLRKIIEGGTGLSYGVQVARLAGIPVEVISRAKEILIDLEKKSHDKSETHPHKGDGKAGQIDLFSPKVDYALADELAGVDILNLTPLQALKQLSELKERAAKLTGKEN